MNKILSIALLLALGFTTIALFATKENATALPPDSATGKAQVGGSFALTDTQGKTRSDTEFRSKFMLVFFGFTHCPDICPTTLATYTSALPMLGDDTKNIAPIFITVDPKRDTPARMKEYLANFDSRIIGLTGSEEQIKQVAQEYKAYYSENSEHGGMDHSGFIYLMNKKGEYVKHFSYDIAPDALVEAIKESMKE